MGMGSGSTICDASIKTSSDSHSTGRIEIECFAFYQHATHLYLSFFWLFILVDEMNIKLNDWTILTIDQGKNNGFEIIRIEKFNFFPRSYNCRIVICNNKSWICVKCRCYQKRVFVRLWRREINDLLLFGIQRRHVMKRKLDWPIYTADLWYMPVWSGCYCDWFVYIQRIDPVKFSISQLMTMFVAMSVKLPILIISALTWTDLKVDLTSLMWCIVFDCICTVSTITKS